MSEKYELLIDDADMTCDFDEESFDAKTDAAGLGYLGSVSKQVDIEQPNGRTWGDKNEELVVPTGTRRVHLYVNRADIGFGTLATLNERPLGRLYYRVNASSFSGTLVTFQVRALCRDINGDDKWWGRITVTAMCYG